MSGAPKLLTSYGIDPIYFGLLFVFNITLGGITPPVGAQLFVASSIWRISMGGFYQPSWTRFKRYCPYAVFARGAPSSLSCAAEIQP